MVEQKFHERKFHELDISIERILNLVKNDKVMKFLFNHDIYDWNLMFLKIFPTMTFLKKKWHFPKKKVMVVKNHNNWKSDKFSSTMTLRNKNVMVGKNEK